MYKTAEDQPQTTAPPTFITALDKITLEQWITCACDNDLSLLTLTGTPTEEESAAAWLQLICQYQTVTKAAGVGKTIELTAKVEALNLKINFVTKLMEVLSWGYEPTIAEALRGWDYDFPFTEETYERDLIKVNARLGNDKTKLAMAMQSYKDQQEEGQKNGTELNRESFMLVLLQIEEIKKMQFDPCELNMYKFALMYRQYVAYAKLLTAKNAAHATK